MGHNTTFFVNETTIEASIDNIIIASSRKNSELLYIL